jgi:predicted small secreted protein
MRTRKLVLALLALAAFAAGGCRLERGIGDGLTDGASAAVAALIEAPVTWWLDQQFGDK